MFSDLSDYTMSNALKPILYQTKSQFKYLTIGVTCSPFFVLVRTLAAGFWIGWSCLMDFLENQRWEEKHLKALQVRQLCSKVCVKQKGLRAIHHRTKSFVFSISVGKSFSFILWFCTACAYNGVSWCVEVWLCWGHTGVSRCLFMNVCVCVCISFFYIVVLGVYYFTSFLA